MDFSTGADGIGATAPNWGAMARRFVGTAGWGPRYSLVGDAELDEGAGLAGFLPACLLNHRAEGQTSPRNECENDPAC